MKVSSIYYYLHVKQDLIRNAIKFSSEPERRKLKSSLKHFERCEAFLDSLCEASYYFTLGQEFDEVER